jgi:hypothetical protein
MFSLAVETLKTQPQNHDNGWQTDKPVTVMASTERARSLGDGPVVTRRSHVTDGVPE